MLFVNLPLRYILDDNHYLQLLLAHTDPDTASSKLAFRLGPELGLDARVLEQDRSWFEALAEKLHAKSICCTVHLPFFDLRVGSPDRMIREASQKRLEMALEITSLFAPKRLIAHPNYLARLDGNYTQGWLGNSVDIWSALIEKLPPDAQLCLENTHELSPEPLVALAAELDPAKCGICFDVGHWFSFANGRQRNNLELWLEALAPYLKHLHLHDNDGSDDQHKGLGQGDIPWKLVFNTLRGLGLTPTATMEPHTEEAFMQSVTFLQNHQEILESIASPGGCNA